MNRSIELVMNIRSKLERQGITREEDEIYANMSYIQKSILLETKIMLISKYDINQLKISSETEPIIPISFDNTIITGTLSQYIPEYSQSYIEELKNIRTNAYTNKEDNSRISRIYNRVYEELEKLNIPMVDDTNIISNIKNVEKNILLETNIKIVDHEEINLIRGLTVPAMCDNAIIYGVITNYKADYLPLYQNELSNIKQNAYTDKTPLIGRIPRLFNKIYAELKKLNIRKVWDDELLNNMLMVQKDIIMETNIVRPMDIGLLIISETAEPILPNMCDNALVFGVLMNYQPKFAELYVNELKNIRQNAYQNQSPCDSRVKTILNNVYAELRKLDIKKVWDDELLNICNKVQDEIMLETRIQEFAINLSTESEQDNYVLDNSLFYQIRDMICMDTKTHLSFVNLESWTEIASDEATGTPQYATLLNNALYLYPVPDKQYNLVMVGFQKNAITKMSFEDEPEIIITADDVITQGVIAHYNPTVFPLFRAKMEMLKDVKIKFSGKRLYNNQMEATW